MNPGSDAKLPKLEISREGEDYLMWVPDEWIVRNPLWKKLNPKVVKEARARLKRRSTVKPIKGST